MILTGLHVKNWRGLDEACLEDLSPRLNLIAGPNESGKSRLFEAMRFALFESHKGSARHKKALQGWGQTGAPWVALGFAVGGDAYRIEKTFLKGASALLQGGGRTWRDQEAEDRLAELLGLDGPPGQRADPASLSFWPLLWLGQFAAGDPPSRDLNEPARSRIQDLLGAEIGEVAAGALGDRVLALARDGAGRYWTPTFRETGELREAVEAEARAREELEAARSKSRELRDVSAELATIEEELARMGERLAKAREELRHARQRAARAQEVRLLIERQQTDVQLAQTGKEDAERAAELRRERVASLAERRQDLARVEEQLRETTERLEARQAERREAEDRLSRARDAARAADDALARAHRRQERTAALQERETLRRGLDEAERVEAELRRLEGEARNIRVTQKRLTELRRVVREWTRAKARLEGAAARLRITARAEVAVDGEPLAPGRAKEWLCDALTSVQIGNVAEIEVLPGGEDLPALRDEVERLGAVQHKALEACGARSPEEAEEHWERLRDLKGRIARSRERVAELCPEGRAEREAALAAIEARLEVLGGDDPEAPPVDAARDEAARAAEAVDSAQAHRDGVAERLADLRSAWSGLDGRRRQLEEEASRLRELVDDMPPQEDLDRRVAEKAAAWQAALAGKSGLEQEYRKAGGDGAAGDLERAEAALRRVEHRESEYRDRRSRLVGTLQTLQGEAVHEQFLEAESRWDEAREHLERTRRWAEAYRCLLQTLERARAEVQERLTAPVADRVAPYLEKIFPGSRLKLSETLDLEGLHTGGLPEPFAALSGGAREQVNVIVRLGLAELFAGDDTLPVVLDDALANTDFARIRRMHSVLYEASRKLQLMVFTCHEEAFDGLGAERVYTLRGGRSAG